MAPKMKLQPRNPPVEDPPTASSSSSSEYEEEEEEDPQPSTQPPAQDFSSSSSEDDEEPSKTPPTNPTSKPSSSESDTPSDSDSEPKPKPTNQAQKPKPQPPPPPKPQSSSAPPKSGSKRPAENSALPKSAKKKPTEASPSVAASDDEAEEDGKKSGGGQLKLFQRLWSEEDELAILKGMAEFISRTGQDPHRYPESFHDTVKKSLHVEASSNQLKEKIRRLKKKFETNLGRGKNGEDPKFSKPHDQTLFDLSKKVWGEASMLVVRPKFNGKPAKSPIPKKEGKSRNVTTTTTPETNTQLVLVDPKGSGKSDIGDVDSLYREISGVKELDEDEMKRGLALIGESKRMELEGRWRKLRRAEIELVANRSSLIGEQIKLIHEALESSDK